MKLLYLLPEYVHNTGGGIIAFYRHLLPLLAAQGHEVRVIVGSGFFAQGSTSPSLIDGVSVENLSEDLLRSYYSQFARYSALPGLRRLLAGAWAMREQAGHGIGFDVVETTDWGLLFLPWAIEESPPTIVQLHGSAGQIDLHDPMPGEEIQGVLLRLLERVALPQHGVYPQALSTANAKAWEQQTGKPVARLLPGWRPMESSAEPAPATERGLVLARLQKWKGPDVLCEALRLLGPEAPLVDWVGRDMASAARGVSMSEDLQARYPDIWGRSLRHSGQRSGAEALQLQKAAAFAVVPSLWDTFNYTCVEAMAAGTPVICSTGAGASELIVDGENGFVFESGNPQALAGAMQKLLSVGSLGMKAIGSAGKETVLRALDPQANAELRVAAYQAAASGGRAALAPDDWLRLAAAPLPGATESLDYLDLIPLRDLVSHTARRSLRKVGV
jgi:glycosyltransferase involved in cell wall biosynthesis